MAEVRDAPPPSAASWGPVDVLLLGAGFGLTVGAAEAITHLLRQRLLHRILFMAPELVWQLPLAEALVFAAAGLLLAGLGLLFRRLRDPQVVLACYAALAAFALLLLSQKIHPAAQAVLAAGAAAATVRLLRSRLETMRRRQRVWVPALLALVLATAAAGRLIRSVREARALAALPAATPGRPNILLLVLDTVRAWNLGVYGYGRPTTPLIRSWAARGAVFERALAPAPWTTISHAVMFTGKHPNQLMVGWATPYDGAHTTLAEVLQRAGYATGGFVGNYLHTGRSTGLAKGFLHYEDYPLEPIPVLRTTTLMGRVLGYDRVARLIGRRRMVRGKLGEEVNREFLGWVGQQRNRPWFAFLNYVDAHGPYLPPVPFDTMYMGRADPVADRYWNNLVRAYGAPPLPPAELSVSLDAYDGAITYLDRQVDAVLRALDAGGQLANTIVVITSDHGELFGEHGVIAHGNNLYLPVLHIPLIVLAPGRVAAGGRVQALASLSNLPATLLDLAGMTGHELPGRSLTGAMLAGGPGGGADTLLSVLDYHRLMPKWPPTPVLRGSMRSVVLDSLHYIRNGDGAEELFHLGQDSWEIRNLASRPEYQEALGRHRAALEAMPDAPGRTARIGSGCGRPNCSEQ